MKREFTIDASSYSDKSDFYTEIEQLFGFPTYYGHNLDDLWDGLTSYIEPNIKIIIHSHQKLIDLFGPEAEGFKNILTRAPVEGRSLEILCNP